MNLERAAKDEAAEMTKEIQYWVFDAMRISEADEKLLDAIIDRGEACTAEEEAAAERFSAEFARAYELVSSRLASQG